MSDLYAGARELGAAYRSGGTSPVEVAGAMLAEIARHEPRINAFSHVDRDATFAEARASEARFRAGAPLGPLDGIPYTAKDNITTAGRPTLRGSKTVDPAGPWTEDAPAVARLREAGAVLLGKTTMPEWGWKGVNDSPLYGITRNPWNLQKTPGGSSGGAAASVALGLGTIALGTDAGGSLRIPASFCGLVTLKPTMGRVPHAPRGAFGSLANVGPIARSVDDVMLAMEAIARPDERDYYERPMPADGDASSRSIAGLRVAYSATLGFADVDSDVAAAARQAVLTFEDLGASVEEIDPPLERARHAIDVLWRAGAAALLRAIPLEKHALMDPGLVAMAEAGRDLSLADFLEAMAVREALAVDMRRFHRRFDLLVTPTMPVAAFDAGLDRPPHWSGMGGVDWTPFTYPFNLTNQPAASAPCALSAEGLPIGLQIVGGLDRDVLVLAATHAFLTARPWNHRPPGSERGLFVSG